jgi:hypothetical protein
VNMVINLLVLVDFLNELSNCQLFCKVNVFVTTLDKLKFRVSMGDNLKFNRMLPR